MTVVFPSTRENFSNNSLNVVIDVPTHAQTGSNVTLSCLYTTNTSGSSLYSIKWYKDSLEVYRFMPCETPSVYLYRIPNVSAMVKA